MSEATVFIVSALNHSSIMLFDGVGKRYYSPILLGFKSFNVWTFCLKEKIARQAQALQKHYRIWIRSKRLENGDGRQTGQ